MSDATCQCGEPAQTGCELCRACERKLKHNLADMEAHRRELLTALTRMVRMTAPNDGGRSTPNLAWSSMGDRYLESISEPEVARILATLPPAVKPATELHAQKSLLVSWVRLFMDDNDRLPMPADTVASLSSHLASWLPFIRKHEAAGEFVAEVREQVRRIFAVIDTPANRIRQIAGPCIERYTDEYGRVDYCPGQIEMVVPRDEDEPARLHCLACQKEWDPTQWTRAGILILRREDELKKQRDLSAEFIRKSA
jgi:hypothetical protein